MFPIRKIITQSIVPTIYRNFARNVRPEKDPGIHQRKKILPLDSIEDEDIDFDDMESDFMNAHKLHVQHEQEVKFRKEQTKYRIVKQKYFKEKYPNFLTWHDKEQIRYLHRTDPEEWTIEKLSEGFPALPHVIQKFVTSHWTKTQPHKITNHDASVQRNWELFKEGKVPDLPKDLAEHLKKFTNRALNFTPFVSPAPKTTTVQVKSKRTSTEFADIIKNYQTLKQVPQIEDHQIVADIEDSRPQSETYVAAPLHRQKYVTLNELQQTVTQKIESGRNISEEEKHMATSLIKKEDGIELPQEQLIDMSLTKYQKPASVQNVQKTQKDLSHLTYPERIHIPKNIFKKGFIYKLNDCYYADDGEFLYRVPGIN